MQRHRHPQRQTQPEQGSERDDADRQKRNDPVVPDRLTLCVWSPALDASGNSWLGMQALEMFVTRTGLSVF